MDNYEKIVSKHWGEMAQKNSSVFNWSDLPFIQKHHNKLQTGNEDLGWLQYFCKKYLLKNTDIGVDKGLSIGCGSGSLERQCRL